MNKINLSILILLIHATAMLNAQQMSNLPYATIPNPNKNYTEGSVASRMVDGLGFRYYWATEGLRDSDLSYGLSEETRSNREIVDHIHHLVNIVWYATQEKTYIKEEVSGQDFEEVRKQTLLKLESISKQLSGASDVDLKRYNLVFEGRKRTAEFPFWNAINGPIADALWHCGQVVMLRRASGNPLNQEVNLFTGRVQ